jgi:hypothetical protein
MQALYCVIGMMLAVSVASAANLQNWEVCLDQADFSFDVDSTILAASTTSASKTACKITFSVSGGRGEKFVVDVCDPQTHVDYYPAIEATSPRRLMAGSAGCPAPLFGADFDDRARDYAEYREVRRRVLELWDKVKEAYGEGWETVDLRHSDSFRPSDSKARIACGQFLLTEYLEKCMSFEPKKPEVIHVGRDTTKPDIPGVHPQTILAPAKK